MGSLRWVWLASLVACGGSPTPRASPPPAKRIPVEEPPVATPQPAKMGEPVAVPTKRGFERASLPVVKPIATEKDSAVARATDEESRIEIYAVDVEAEPLLFVITPRIDWAFKSTGKRFTGALYAPDHHWDAFGTIAAHIGADVTPITPGTKKYRGATIDFQFTAAPLHDLLRFIADTGGLNIVVAPGDHPALTVRAKRMPWDLALETFVARAGLTFAREGNVYYIVPPGTTIAPKKRYGGPIIDLDVRDGTVADAVTALRALVPLELGSCSTTPLTSFRVKRMPLEQVVKALEVASGEKLTEKAPCAATPLADEPASELKLTAVATTGTTRAAVFAHKGGIRYGTRKGQPRIKDIGAGYVVFDSGDALELYRSTTSDTPRPLPAFVRTAALVKRGESSVALVEMAGGDVRYVSATTPPAPDIRAEVTNDGVNLYMPGEPDPRVLLLAPR